MGWWVMQGHGAGSLGGHRPGPSAHSTGTSSVSSWMNVRPAGSSTQAVLCLYVPPVAPWKPGGHGAGAWSRCPLEGGAWWP